MSTILDAQGETTQGASNPPTEVHIRLMFLRVGEIDTLNEKYQAQLAIEARWPININKLSPSLSSDDKKHLIEGKSISLLNYGESHWHPQLYIENAIGDLKDKIRYSAKKSIIDNEIYICEHHDIKGLFWVQVELKHFPCDVQDLSISIASMLYDDKAILVPDPHHLSGVIEQVFVDQHVFAFYKHVDTEQRHIKEFIFQPSNKYDEDDERGSIINNDDRKCSLLIVTCHVARRPNYYFWNCYCLILVITLVCYCIFAIPANLPQNRLQSSCTLLLTSITFRWTINRSLPTVSYLTSLDKYAILCIFIIVGQCIWHAIIGVVIFLTTPQDQLTPSMWYTRFDRYVFIALISVFIIMHILLIIWLYKGPLRYRKNMSKKDLEYQCLISDKKNEKNSKPIGKKSATFLPFMRIPIETKA